MKRVIKVLKFIGLIILALGLNIVPMRLIATQGTTSVAFHWGAGIMYLIIASLILRITWKRYQKAQADGRKQFTFTWKDFGIALLFYLVTRVVVVGGTLLIQLVTGNPLSANDAALMATSDQLLNMFPLYFIAFHVAIGIFAPIMEELVFRGFFGYYFFKSN